MCKLNHSSNAVAHYSGKHLALFYYYIIVFNHHDCINIDIHLSQLFHFKNNQKSIQSNHIINNRM